jgi:4-diphosphocytidyl-2-C-methyl-D-erythritol kinase
MMLERLSPCKVNLLLNILGKRADGYHELETVLHPVKLFDRLSFEREGSEVALTCSDPSLSVDSTNLAHRAATVFLDTAGIRDRVRIHLEKSIPMAAGLGGGSSNAATTLLGLNELFGQPLSAQKLIELAAALGSDVPFFLQDRPALATGRGECVTALEPFRAMEGLACLLINPGFGIPTPWAYRELAKFPEALHGRPGRAQRLVSLLQGDDITRAGAEFYNSLEVPALHTYPVLARYQECLRANGAVATLMSGSGSTTFALARNQLAGEALAERFKEKFGQTCWMAVVAL